MANNKDLELALRIKADLKQGQAALEQLGESVEAVGDKAAVADKNLGKIGESADQQAARIKAMVSASLAQQSALDAVAGSTSRVTNAVREGNANWRENAAAQTAAINTYHNAERAQRERAAAEQRAAENAAKATAEAGKQENALRRLLGSIDNTERALAKLDQQELELTEHFRRGGIEAGAYAANLDKIRSRRDALNGVTTEARRSNLAMNGLTASIRQVQGLLVTGFAGYGLTSASRAIVNTTLQWQQALFTLEAATGSTAKARQELEYVREVSERLGLELLSTSQAYGRLVAAAKETPALGTAIRGIFEGVSSATTALHLTREETNGILLALEQMVSKGKVQTQELVLQLGQRVPGAFGLAAKALGTNTAQLSQWLEKGMIPAAEFLPRFAAALQEAYGPSAQKAASGLNAEINRLTNAWTEFKVEAGEAGFIDSYTQAIRDLQVVLKDPAVKDGLNTLITALGKLIEYGAKGIAGAAGVVKFLAEESAARFGGGPSADDPVRLEDAIERESKNFARFQQILDEAYAKGDDETAARYEKALSETQANLDKWRLQLQDFYTTATPPLVVTSGQPAGGSKPAPFKPTGDDKGANRLAKQNEDFVKQLEKEAATYGKGKAALREYELDQRHLTGTLKARAEAAYATLDAAEKQKKVDQQAAKDTKLLAQLQLDYLKATGQNVDAAGAEIEKKFGALQKRLAAAGNNEGASLVGKLINIEQAKAELEQLDQALERIFAEQSRREQTINTQQQAGLISELGARQQILDLNKLTADQVEKLLPKMRELAAVTGDPAAIERVKDLETRLGNLRTVANEFSNALKAGFETGIQGALRGLADGTMDLQEAALSFVQAIASSLADLASQQLAKMASDSLAGLLSSGASAATDVAADTAGATATAAAITTASTAGATAMGTGITAAGASAAGVMASSITAAGASAASAMAAAIASAGAANSTSSALSSAASVAVAAATGGQVLGPGTGTSDSIPALLSHEEFITRAAVVTQPGALGFLHDFNARGMAALDDWAHRVRHSTGGLAGVPAPAMANPSLGNTRLAEPAKSMSTNLKNNVNLYAVQRPEDVAGMAWGKAGQEHFLVYLQQNGAEVRQLLGI